MSSEPTTAWVVTAARAHGEDAAIRFDGRQLSWAELASQAHSLAAQFSRLGVARGDVVAVRMAPHPRMVAMLHALQMLGSALLPVNLRLTGPEVERILTHASPRLFVDEREGAMDTGGLRRVHPFADLDDTGAARSFATPGTLDPDATLTVVYTSGTTAAPKGVILTNANHAAAAAASRRRLGHGRDDAWLATLPLFHVGGLAILTRSVLEGSVVLLEGGFDDARAAEALEHGDATMVSMVPTMLARVLERLCGAASPRLRCVLVGGAALSPALARRAIEASVPIAATYGMTEACSQICTTAPASDDAAHGLVGLPLDGIDLTIRDADKEGRGEILIRGAAVTRGYLRNPQADRAALCDGWLRTGDIGRLDDHGRLAVSGRRSDLIVTGGENVAPLEVEQVLDEHPDVAESMVTGVDDEVWGQRIVALVVARRAGEDHRERLPDALREWCRTRLASYKTPREIRVVGALPRNATGKLLRRSVS